MNYNCVDKDQLIFWAKSQLEDPIEQVEDVVQTAYSYVLKLKTQKSFYYLKRTPPKLYIEASIIDLLRNECALNNVPEIFAKNDELSCFLMPSCGDLTLRDVFDKNFDISLFYQGLNSYHTLQVRSSSHIQKFLDIGVPDWRIPNLPSVYNSFINDKNRLSEWGLSMHEQFLIDSSEAIFSHFCEELERFDLPATLNHSDFHPNGMLLDKTKGEIKIIDLGEVTVGNPLFSLASCLTNYMDYRYKIRANVDLYKNIRSEIGQAWNISDDQLIELIEIIGPLNYVLTFYELIKITDYSYPKWKMYINDSFLMFLANLNEKYALIS